MKMFDNIKKFFNPNRQYRGQAFDNHILQQSRYDDFQYMAESRSLSYLTTCVDAIANTVSSQGFALVSESNKEEVEFSQLQPELQSLFCEENIGLSFQQILKMMVRNLVVDGNFYLYPTKSNYYDVANNFYSEYIPVNSYAMDIISRDNFTVDKYQFNLGSSTYTVEDSEIYHFKESLEESYLKGVGRLQKSDQLLKLLYYGFERTVNLFRNDGKPSGFIVDQNRGSEDAVRQRRQIVESFLNPSNVNKFLYLHNPPTSMDGSKARDSFDFVEMNPMSSRDMMATDLFDIVKKAIYDLFGYYQLDEGVNRASAYIKKKRFYEVTVNPLINLINSQITRKITSKYGLEFKISKAEVFDSEMLPNYVAGGILSPNEARVALGFKAVEDNAQMDDYYFNAGLVGTMNQVLEDSE